MRLAPVEEVLPPDAGEQPWLLSNALRFLRRSPLPPPEAGGRGGGSRRKLIPCKRCKSGKLGTLLKFHSSPYVVTYRGAEALDDDPEIVVIPHAYMLGVMYRRIEITVRSRWLRNYVGFINMGSLADQLPSKGSAQIDKHATHGLTQVSKQQARRAIQSPTGRSGQGGAVPVCRLRPTSPTGVLTSISSLPPDGLSDWKAWPKHYF